MDEARKTRHQNEQRKRRRYLAEHLDEEVIRIIEERFECNLPCFQGHAGAYDPLDAMRRDAYREVTLWLRRELNLYRKENHDD